MNRLIVQLVLAAVVYAGDPVADRANRKLIAMTEERLGPGARVTWNLAELNAWVKQETPEQLPPGVTNTRIALGQGTIDAFATVDFLKIAQADGKPVNPIIAKLIEGERPLKFTLKVDSSKGRITIALTQVEISGIPISGPALGLLLQTFFLAYHPNAHINEPFDLDYGLDHVEVTPRGITAYHR